MELTLEEDLEMKQKAGRRTRWSLTLIGALLVTAGIYGCDAPAGQPVAAAAKRQPFDLGMVTFAGYAPLYLAKEKGFFGDLDVRLHRIEEVASLRAGMASGKLAGYLATTDIALDTNSRPPGVAVWAVDESAGGDGVVVSGIDNLAALRGKTVAAEPGLPPHFILLYLLHQNGLSVSDVRLQDMSTQDAATAFASSKVQAAGLYEPYLTRALKQRPGTRIVVSSAQTPGLIVDLIFLRDDVLGRRQDVLALIQGWRRALAFIHQSPDEAYRIMSKAFNLPVPEFRETAAAVRWLDLPENRTLFGTAAQPGPLYSNFVKIHEILAHNRPGVAPAAPDEHLSRAYVEGLSGR
jgi:NitT/TauT family transport system substrate-binding protein